ncbi:hypothetical protein QVD17_18192 [Tagetes erecta]|uniref:Transmembrane protein n=1 Tax=Tagetes erecta TaxID=13708 RepID=A0AAD8KK08_TARER|nr:hypothetical protein QVD17_18192 [Tagetes erecta]
MNHFKVMLFSFFFAGILIPRSTAIRPVYIQVQKELESNGSDKILPAFAPDSTLVHAHSPSGPQGESGEQMVHTESHHHSSVAGGGVIIGGLATVTFAAVYCYIRVTRRRNIGVN